MRKVKNIYQENQAHWVGDGFLVQPLFSHMGEDRGTNPFLMLDYAAPQYYEPNSRTPRGVGQHPHKGFETVTIAYQGEVEHRDSSGGGGVIKAGDVQWMTAGAGIIHQEFHSEAFSRRGGMFEMVQLWVNLPRKDKNVPAHYQHLAKENIPVVAFADNAGYARIIAGNFAGIQGAAKTYTKMNVWDMVINAGCEVEIEIPESQSLSMVVLRGKATFNHNEQASAGQLVNFERSAGKVTITAADEELKILLLAGEPIEEPVVGYGPFVMNSFEEIRQAVNDFNAGKFGQIEN
ncbi:pirin family protein [Gallibacterium anatis]|uniref:Pirin family protein n=1 Tax=Gallibacterium anatis TaxID=750 RepID=A0AAX3XC39_9PAST|nr:pirin family protein [Gallibacterium anatis]MDK9430119.1 pirin family protein [Gallibacterium anatis]MDK9560243.1 pirin family protein [Gallibacterium anatis]WIM79768.1 pirin family protein [Gallibacterium anatis]